MENVKYPFLRIKKKFENLKNSYLQIAQQTLGGVTYSDTYKGGIEEITWEEKDKYLNLEFNTKKCSSVVIDYTLILISASIVLTGNSLSQTFSAKPKDFIKTTNSWGFDEIPNLYLARFKRIPQNLQKGILFETTNFTIIELDAQETSFFYRRYLLS